MSVNDLKYYSIGAFRTLPKIYIVGDSRGDQSSDVGRTTARGWLWWLQLLTDARFDFQPADNFAVGGYDTSQMLADVGLLLDVEPGIVIAICSTNDRTAGMTADASIANMAEWQRFVAGFHKVIWLGETPRGDASDGTYTLSATNRQRHLRVRNWQLSRMSLSEIVYVADAWAALSDVNSTTALANTGLFYDGLHFGPPGARLQAEAIAPIINHLLPPRPRLIESLANLWATNNPTGSLNANPVLAGTGGSGGTGTVATSWTVTEGAGLTATCSKVTVDAINRQRIVVTGTATAANSGASPIDPTPYSVVCSVPVDHTNISVGDVIEASGYLSIAAGSSGLRGVAIYLSITTASGTTTYAAGEPGSATSVPNLDFPSTAIAGTAIVPRATITQAVTAASLSVVITGRPNNTFPISATVEFTKVSARKVL